MKSPTYPLRIGIFGIGLDAYWTQFDGLEARLKGYVAELSDKVARPGVEIVNLGLIDNPPAAVEAGHALRRADVDLVLLHVTTYALSNTVLPVVQLAKVPVLVLNLQPGKRIDYASFNALGDRTRMTGEWLAYCAACPVPEIANVFKRARIPFHQLTGTLDGDAVFDRELDEWIEAARVAQVMRHNRMGLMGHYYSGMLDIYSDLTLQCATFGGHMEIIEVDELSGLRETVTREERNAKREVFRQRFEILPECSEAELDRAATTAVALDKLVARHALGSMAYYYKGEGVAANESTLSSIILGNSLLTGAHVPVAGEYEVKNAQAMKILDTLGVGGSFTEYYAMDFEDDIVLMGHDGPGHIAIAEGRPKVKPLEVYHGKVGKGLSIEMSVKHGPVTLLSVVEDGNNGIKLLVAEGESVPGPILEIGNTNSRYRFPGGARSFVERWNAEGPAHHCAVGVGHVASTLAKFAALLGIAIVQVSSETGRTGPASRLARAD